MDDKELKTHFEKQLPNASLRDDAIRYIEECKFYW